MIYPRTPGEWLSAIRVPWRPRAEAVRDVVFGPPHATDPGIVAVATSCADWLREAQDRSASNDGGVARHFSLRSGWSDSYPETTGYIVPTMLAWARVSGDGDFHSRARRMLDWLTSIQFDCGAFPGGTIWQVPQLPVTFNTGQVLLGLAAGAKEWPEFLGPMARAADWLCDTQDADGAWRAHPSPFSNHEEQTYEAHVAWGLFEAARVASDSRYASYGLANVRWALQYQASTGWFARCCLEDPERPLTHTLGYVLRGVVEAYRISGDTTFLDSATRCAEGAMSALLPSGALPGHLNSNWGGPASWSCLTGSAQIAHCWLMLAEMTGRTDFSEAGHRALAFVRRTVRLEGPASVRGGVKGSFPVNGGYCWWEYPNWAAKFLLDALVLEGALLPRESSKPGSSELGSSVRLAPSPIRQ